MEQSELYAKHPQPLISLLNLEPPDKYEQDWEYCVSDKERVKEFIEFYIATPLNDYDKRSLMMIILDSCNDRGWDRSLNRITWRAVRKLIEPDLLFYKDEIVYWSSMGYSDSEMDDAWAIAPEMRVLLRGLYENNCLTEEDMEDWCSDALKHLTDPPRSRYDSEKLIAAYDNITLGQIEYDEVDDVWDIPLPVFSTFDEEMWASLHMPKEKADSLMKSFLAILHKIDDIVQDDGHGSSIGDPHYDIPYFDVYDNKVVIRYWGNRVNTMFDVNVFTKSGEWYFTDIGLGEYDPPERIV